MPPGILPPPPDLARLKKLSRCPAADGGGHYLWVLSGADALPEDLPHRAFWQRVLQRRVVAAKALLNSPQVADLPSGGRMTLVMLAADGARFERLTALRNAAMSLLEEHPETVSLVVCGPVAWAADALQVLWQNGVPLPAQKKKVPVSLAQIHYFGPEGAAAFAAAAAVAEANLLTRWLTALPPNRLTPRSYRRYLKGHAKALGWQWREFDFAKLRRLGAGAFCAVAQGSGNGADGGGAAIVHLSHCPPRPRLRLALVGKGICFDTGGHNLKPARYMQSMHQDMNGSAVVLGLMQAITTLKLPIAVDAWLAIAHNHLSPAAFTQDDIVTTLDGTHVEIVHTDAEGRLVLADALSLATRGKEAPKPDLVMDFATLTGSMHTALGTRYSGVFASAPALASGAVASGVLSGERVCVFPLDSDYAKALDSKVADIKQCTLEGEADHILAALFLQRFVKSGDWLHMDLSAATCEGGLGGVATAITGFGVDWGVHFLKNRLA